MVVDAFSFFTNPANGGTADDDDGQPVDGADTPVKKPPRKRAKKVDDGEPKEPKPKAKRAPRKKKEPVAME